MQNRPNSQDAVLHQAMDMAKTPAGQALIALLQKSGGKALEEAMAAAAAGDPTRASKLLQGMMADPEARRLFREMGGQDG